MIGSDTYRARTGTTGHPSKAAVRAVSITLEMACCFGLFRDRVSRNILKHPQGILELHPALIITLCNYLLCEGLPTSHKNDRRSPVTFCVKEEYGIFIIDCRRTTCRGEASANILIKSLLTSRTDASPLQTCGTLSGLICVSYKTSKL